MTKVNTVTHPKRRQSLVCYQPAIQLIKSHRFLQQQAKLTQNVVDTKSNWEREKLQLPLFSFVSFRRQAYEKVRKHCWIPFERMCLWCAQVERCPNIPLTVSMCLFHFRLGVRSQLTCSTDANWQVKTMSMPAASAPFDEAIETRWVMMTLSHLCRNINLRTATITGWLIYCFCVNCGNMYSICWRAEQIASRPKDWKFNRYRDNR